jgi:hypothetical protein
VQQLLGAPAITLCGPTGSAPRSAATCGAGIAGPIKVPSCLACNGGSSKDDEYFRLRIVARHDVGDHPGVSPVRDAALRGLARGEASRFRRAFLASVGRVELRTPAGVYLGSRLAYRVWSSETACSDTEWVQDEADPAITRWLFIFHDAVPVLGSTDPRARMLMGTRAIGFHVHHRHDAPALGACPQSVHDLT